MEWQFLARGQAMRNHLWQLLLVSVSALLLAACGGGGQSSLLCSEEVSCPEGMACDPGGMCIEAEDLAIATEALDPAAVGVAYQFTLQATGGIPPYHDWAVDTLAGWIGIDPDSGVLSGTPDAGSLGLTVTVSVYDSSYGDGALASKSFQLVVSDCDQEGLQQACFDVQEGLCRAGAMTCHDGKWSSCSLTGLSQDIDHCGPECSPCDQALADRCLGECLCGSNPPCDSGKLCCLGLCLDPATSRHHCGACDNDCDSAVQNALGVECLDGACSYTECRPGFLDCNDDAADGCETAVDVNHCGNCETDCLQQTVNAQDVTCEQLSESSYRCNYTSCAPGFFDCDTILRNGCEASLSDARTCGSCDNNCLAAGNNTACLDDGNGNFHCGCRDDNDCSREPPRLCCDGRCVDADDPAHCGSCDVDCGNDAAGPLCIDPATSQCGCFDRFDCGGHNLCCDAACLPVDDQHCGDCSIACGPQYGGPHCDIDTESCYCQGNEECAGFGSGTCVGSGVDARCQ